MGFYGAVEMIHVITGKEITISATGRPTERGPLTTTMIPPMTTSDYGVYKK